MNNNNIHTIIKEFENIITPPFKQIWNEFDILKEQLQNLKLWFTFFTITIIMFILLSIVIVVIHLLKLEKEIKNYHKNNLILQDKIINLINENKEIQKIKKDEEKNNE